MTEKLTPERKARILAAAERHFGAPVDAFGTPGGEDRAAYRLRIAGMSVIATCRDNPHRTHLEAVVLAGLAEHCDCVPKVLGLVDDVLFQQDAGALRLNQAAARAGAAEREALAAAAIDSIFRMQAAARKAGLLDLLPPLGNRAWLADLVEAARYIEGHEAPLGIDGDAALAALRARPAAFVKWDARAGNAAIGADDVLRWFDFEFAGRRRGVEDLAWLIGDETWPVPAETMLELIAELAPNRTPAQRARLVSDAALFATFHAAKRIALLHEEIAEGAWVEADRALALDHIGTTPEFAARLARNAAICASRHPITRPLAARFARAAEGFAEEDGRTASGGRRA